MQNFRALGAPPPHPRASGGWGLCPQTPSLRQLGASPPDPHWLPAAGGSAPRPPKQPPPLRISGYAPASVPYFLAKIEAYRTIPTYRTVLPFLQWRIQNICWGEDKIYKHKLYVITKLNGDDFCS